MQVAVEGTELLLVAGTDRATMVVRWGQWRLGDEHQPYIAHSLLLQ